MSNGRKLRERPGRVRGQRELQPRHQRQCLHSVLHRRQVRHSRKAGSMSKKKQRLARGERDLIRALATTSEAYSTEYSSVLSRNGLVPIPETVTLAMALRLAEKGFRRGFDHGAHAMRWHLYPESAGEWHRDGPPAPGYEYTQRIGDWRSRGLRQYYIQGEHPPIPHPTDPAFVVRGDGRVRR